MWTMRRREGHRSPFATPPNERHRSLARDQEGDRSSGPPAREAHCKIVLRAPVCPPATNRQFLRKMSDLSSPHGARRRAHVHNGTPSSSSAGHVVRSRSHVCNGRGRSHDTFATIKGASWSCGSRHSGLRPIGGHSEYGQRCSHRPGTVFVDRVCPQHQRLFAARFDRALESQRCARNPVCPLGRRGARRDRKDAGREKVTHHLRPAAGISSCQSLPARLFSYCDFMSEARTVRSSSITLATCNCMTSSCCA